MESLSHIWPFLFAAAVLACRLIAQKIGRRWEAKIIFDREKVHYIVSSHLENGFYRGTSNEMSNMPKKKRYSNTIINVI